MKTPTLGTVLASLQRTHLLQDLNYLGEPGYIYRLAERLPIDTLGNRLEMPVERVDDLVIKTARPLPVDPLRALCLEALSLAAREALIDSMARALDARESSAFLHRDGQRLAVIAGSAKQEGVLRILFFCRTGARGDLSVKTLADALRRLGNGSYIQHLSSRRADRFIMKAMSHPGAYDCEREFAA